MMVMGKFLSLDDDRAVAASLSLTLYACADDNNPSVPDIPTTSGTIRPWFRAVVISTAEPPRGGKPHDQAGVRPARPLLGLPAPRRKVCQANSATARSRVARSSRH